jgi:hypothetical protein
MKTKIAIMALFALTGIGLFENAAIAQSTLPMLTLSDNGGFVQLTFTSGSTIMTNFSNSGPGGGGNLGGSIFLNGAAIQLTPGNLFFFSDSFSLGTITDVNNSQSATFSLLGGFSQSGPGGIGPLELDMAGTITFFNGDTISITPTASITTTMPFSMISPISGSSGYGAANSMSTLFNWQISAVPEPSTLALAGLGAASLLAFRRRK